jgi:hypothetical protein
MRRLFIVFSGLFCVGPPKGHIIATGFGPANHNGVIDKSNEEERTKVAVFIDAAGEFLPCHPR